MRRRDLLAVMGGTAIMPACSAGPDLEAAWRDPGAGERDPRRRALAWGILAPNPHNMQPWMVDLSRPGEATVHVHPDRLLPETDPFNRQIVIGCGAFCELTRMAAARDGWRVAVEPFPEGEPAPRLDPRPVARLRFERASARGDPLLAHVLARRTNRGKFDDRPVPPDQAAAIAQAGSAPTVRGQATVDPARTAVLRAIAYEGSRVEAHTPDAHRESMDRLFIGAREIAAHPYGISIRGPMPEALHAVGLLDKRSMSERDGVGFKQADKMMRTAADTAKGFVWLTTAGNSRAEQFAAGAAYLRANLHATQLGVAMHPWSQCLQEYATMAPSLAAAHRVLAPEGGRVQMFARLGYGAPVPPAPKRGLEAQILRT